MAGGFGDIIGGIGSIAGSIINAKNQARANDIAEQNSIMQYMLGNRNINVQERLGTRNIDLQEEFGNRNFKLQKDTSRDTYALADTQGSKIEALIRAMGGKALDARQQGLDTQRAALGTQREGLGIQRDALRFGRENADLQRSTAKESTRLQRDNANENIDLAKASRFDARGNEVYYDPATKSFKVRLDKKEQQLMDANQQENLLRSTVDQQRARRGNEANEEMRTTAQSMLADAVRNQRFGDKPVNEGALANELIVANRGEQEDKLKTIRDSLSTMALRTNNSSSIEDIGKQVRNSRNDFGSTAADAMLKAKKFALDENGQDQQRKDARVNLLSALSRLTGDQNNAMGDSAGFATTTQQADAGGDRLAKANTMGTNSITGAMDEGAQRVGSALLQQGAGQDAFGTSTKQMGIAEGAIGAAEGAMGDAYTTYGSNVGNAISSRTNSMINALTNGAAAQGSAITNQASASGGAYSNLMSALANAYTSQADGVGSAMSQQAKLMASTKLDLSGLGKIGSGLGGLAAAFASTSDGPGGVTTVNKRAF